MSARTYIDTAKFFLSKSLNLAHYLRVIYWYAESTKNLTKEAFIKKSAEFKSFDGIKCEGRSFMVTGATSSIAIAVCEYIVKKEGTHLHAICQSESRAAYFTQIITPVTHANSKFTVHVVDLSEPQIVQKFVQKFIKEKIPLHVLVNNGIRND
uniref:Dehydrogenase/reductase SDR family member 12 (Trinotate prediction) n=1 Tax=Myxobolus squamalis TaxID=59785 RepID=A0A6B2G6B2_MYXSQ